MERSENNPAVNRRTFNYGSPLMSIVFLVGLFLVPVWAIERDSVGGSVMATQIFHHPDPDVLDGFGMSMAGHQHMVLIGAPNEVHNGHEAGRAYVVERKTGHLIHALGLPNPTGGALFGQSVALTGRYAAIGAPHARDGEGTYTGGVYLYDQVTGKHTRTITNPNPVTGAFGHAIAMRGKRVVIGDPQASTTTTYYTGAAYAFDVTTGERLLTLHPLNPIPGKPSGFGHAVDFSESMIVIAAPAKQIESIPAGMVYGFNAKTGDFVRTFVSPHPMESYFGWSVAVAEDFLLIGAFGYERTFREEGIVYVFDVESGKLIRSLRNPDPQEGAHFGKAVAILHNFLIVGAPGDRAKETGMSRGAVYVFDRMSGRLLEKVVNPARPTGADDLFGVALGAAEEQLLVGAPFGGKGTELDAGLVYDFDVTRVGLSEIPPGPSETDTVPPPVSQ
jgi:outer membrane protein assembly factor BamB